MKITYKNLVITGVQSIEFQASEESGTCLIFKGEKSGVLENIEIGYLKIEQDVLHD